MTDNISEALHKLISSYRGAIKQMAGQRGIDLPITYIRTLKCIKKIPHCCATDISMRLRLDKSQVTRIIKALFNEGYVDKVKHPNNHRSQILLLTGSGKELMDLIAEIDQEVKNKMSIGLTNQQVQNFIVIADIMKNNLCEDFKEN